MELVSTAKVQNQAGFKSDRLMRRMMSPLTGLDKTVGFALHDRGSPRLYLIVAQMTAIHRLVGMSRPLSYHLGGYGVNREEAFMRMFGETIERYAHMAYLIEKREIVFLSYSEMQRRGNRALALEKESFYTLDQFNRPAFPFQPFDPDSPLGWIEGYSLPSLEPQWIPAQFVLIGYRPLVSEGERRLNLAVTTGTAAHTIPQKACISALLELIQMDTAMGHWYSGQVAPMIVLDQRTPILKLILKDVATPCSYDISFHYLANPDLPAHVVACVLWNRRREIPSCAVGIACELGLEFACYKAFLEASAIPHLALLGLLQAPQPIQIDPAKIDNLDLNVIYYGLPENRHYLEKRFVRDQMVAASDLPRYPKSSLADDFKFLVNAFRDTGKRIYLFDLTTPDIRELGFYVYRIYSPDLLTLCWPSFPHKAHHRFEKYGGVRHEDPHPYP